MFGMGMGEIVLIAVVALLFVGPDRLPEAARAIGKGIRDLRQQTKDLTSTIENDSQIGDAVREIRGALRGDPEYLYRRTTGQSFNDSDAKGAAADSGADPAVSSDSGDAVSAENGDELDELSDLDIGADDALASAAAHETAPANSSDPNLPKLRPAEGTEAQSASTDEPQNV